ncbi:MAG TPA: CoA ester lyase [Rubrivivax sp.]|nr:CoA ester lyase [Rubrivivax sp.]
MNTNDALAQARSLLFVPGNRPERFLKAAQSGADAVVLDLEDAVPLAQKDAARDAIGQQWAQLLALQVPLVVRINAADSAAWPADLAALARLPQLAAVMVPKAESAETLRQAHHALAGVALLPLIESAAGYDALAPIAAAPGVLRLVLGHIDFMADTGLQCSDDERELAPLRFAIAMATRRQRLAPAIDGVTVAIDDAQRLREDTQGALRFGFGAKLCIHPRQVAGVHEALAPSAAELDWARRVVAADAAAAGAAVQLDGRMVDAPVVLQARRVLARAGA